jgi:hypothetical protein
MVYLMIMEGKERRLCFASNVVTMLEKNALSKDEE